MPRSATVRRLAPALTALPASPLTVEKPPAAALAGGAKIIQLITTPVFRVGEYEVGDGYCPHLHGHPGIRY
ncbi:hypothetical protein GCM10028824_39350 [Hymenobacter segetis]|uniref:AraC family transcriptional regulator n=1 Tax=Hymenobacter segetis TaxID=2025509 RepID=A0ABU9LTD0_9BACT